MKKFKEQQEMLKVIQDHHKALILRMRKPEEIDVEQVGTFLNMLAQGGSIIEDAENRALLQELIRNYSGRLGEGLDKADKLRA